MRLVCPNCDAEYEVDASAIPDAGRDVQCSNCGHAWFQLSPGVEEALSTEEALYDPPPALETAVELSGNTNEAAAPAFDPPPRSLDESVLAVLREEAERESTARRAEAPPAIETQTELGLSAAVAATVAAASMPAEPEAQPDPVSQRIARMKGIEPAPAKPQTRREMLPEIDEINTTLRATSERRTGEAGAIADSLPAAKGSASFRTGFALMILLALGIVALYVMAPKLADQIPAARGALEGYVGVVDGARMWLDSLLKSATGAMESKSP